MTLRQLIRSSTIVTGIVAILLIGSITSVAVAHPRDVVMSYFGPSTSIVKLDYTGVNPVDLTLTKYSILSQFGEDESAKGLHFETPINDIKTMSDGLFLVTGGDGFGTRIIDVNASNRALFKEDPYRSASMILDGLRFSRASKTSLYGHLRKINLAVDPQFKGQINDPSVDFWGAELASLTFANVGNAVVTRLQVADSFHGSFAHSVAAGLPSGNGELAINLFSDVNDEGLANVVVSPDGSITVGLHQESRGSSIFVFHPATGSFTARPLGSLPTTHVEGFAAQSLELQHLSELDGLRDIRRFGASDSGDLLVVTKSLVMRLHQKSDLSWEVVWEWSLGSRVGELSAGCVLPGGEVAVAVFDPEKPTSFSPHHRLIWLDALGQEVSVSAPLERGASAVDVASQPAATGYFGFGGLAYPQLDLANIVSAKISTTRLTYLTGTPWKGVVDVETRLNQLHEVDSLKIVAVRVEEQVEDADLNDSLCGPARSGAEEVIFTLSSPLVGSQLKRVFSPQTSIAPGVWCLYPEIAVSGSSLKTWRGSEGTLVRLVKEASEVELGKDKAGERRVVRNDMEQFKPGALPEDDEGCGCSTQVLNTSKILSNGLLLGLVMLALTLFRRRRLCLI